MTILRSIAYDYKTKKITATLCDYGSQKFDVVEVDDGYRIFNIDFNDKCNREDYEDLKKFLEEFIY